MALASEKMNYSLVKFTPFFSPFRVYGGKVFGTVLRMIF